MKAFTLKENSWHFWLVNFGEKRIKASWGDTDICEYTRCFLKGLFWFIIAATMISLFSTFVIASLVNIFATVFLGYILAPWSIAFLLIVGSLGCAASAIKFSEYYSDRRSERYRKMRELQNSPDWVPPEPGFLTLLYRKFKDKTCVRIKIERATND